jgi:biotin synthase
MSVNLSTREIEELLEGSDDRWLFEEARRVKAAVFGKDVYFRGVVEFSNYCAEDCYYCGLRAGNRNLYRYRLTKEEILETAEMGYLCGLKTIVLQSGDDHFYKKDDITFIIREILSRMDVVITLSLGERSLEEIKEWRKAGAERYLLKIETFNKALYEKYRPGRKLEERIRLLEYMKGVGYETGSGIIVGLPGQTVKDIAADLHRLSELELEMIAVGPFIPHPETPLGLESPGNPLLSLRCIAVLRILNPLANIPSTSALASFGMDFRAKGLEAGANVVMPSITPSKVRLFYKIYPGKNEGCMCVIEEMDYLKKMVENAGHRVSDSKGYSPRRFYAKGS